jgi:hypothetical protein
MEIKDFIGKVVISAKTKERYILTKVASPYIEVKTEKLNEYGGRSCYRFETINGDPFTRGVLVFEDASLMLPFQKAYEAYSHSEDARWEEYGYWMRKD